MSNPVIQAATLPFQITESLAIACGYERSFKLTGNSILANRYLLGINTADVTAQQLLNACQKLDMPQMFLEQFQDELTDANLVFLGFEADATGGALFKVYIEYWDLLQKKLLQDPLLKAPHLLHKGFKWQYDAPDKSLVTEYFCLPNQTTDEIRQSIQSQYRDSSEQNCLAVVNRIIDIAEANASGKQFIYVEVSEPGNCRKSFDLNLYPAELTVKDIAIPLTEAIALLGIDRETFDRLMSIIQHKLFGHISAGIARNGEEYLTIYYEN